MTHFFRSFYKYLVTERLGYRRPTRPVLPVLPDDHAIRDAEAERLERLEQNVRYLDANIDLIRIGKSSRRQLS